jgi:hypothetical protein
MDNQQEVGAVLTTPHHKNQHVMKCYKGFKLRLILWSDLSMIFRI